MNRAICCFVFLAATILSNPATSIASGGAMAADGASWWEQPLTHLDLVMFGMLYYIVATLLDMLIEGGK